MDERFSVKKRQGIQGRLQEITRFLGCQGSLGKNLGQVFFRELHYDVKPDHVVELAASGFEQLQQMGMRKLCGQFPAGELTRGIRRIHGDEFDGSSLRIPSAPLGKKYGAMI